MKNNIQNTFFVLIILLIVCLGCKKLTSTESAETDDRPDVIANKDNEETSDTESKENKDVEKADFTTTAEELDKAFTREGVTDEDLKKYANKSIAVSGRVSTLALEKKGTTQPWVTLYAPGVLHGVSCYFDDENVEQMKQLKQDKPATIQGFQSDFIVPKISPRLDHCVVLEAN